jgi:hypothetical protein
MYKAAKNSDKEIVSGSCKIISRVLWLSVATGWAVSIFSVIEEMCLATACSDAASFTLFGFGLGPFGIAYFSCILVLLWLRKKVYWSNWLVAAMVFSGIGSEFRLLWIQKYIIGSWCPLCVSICAALFCTALLLLIEKIRSLEVGQGSSGKRLMVWLIFITTMAVIGLVVAIVGVKALSV